MWPLSIDETIKLFLFPTFVFFGYSLFTSKGAVFEEHIKRFSGTPGSFWNLFYTSNARLMHRAAPEVQSWMLQMQRKLFTYFGVVLMIMGTVGFIGIGIRTLRVWLAQ